MQNSFDRLDDTPNYDINGLNPGYTFERLVDIVSTNRVSGAAARCVAENPGQVYNPLFIYSGIGLGRHQLIQAIGNFFLELQPEKMVRYLTAERIADEIIKAVKLNALAEFREDYAKTDLLLIEDFQLVAADESVQAEILGLFTSLIQTQRQLVIGCDRSPRALLKITDQLRQLLGTGLITDLQLPDYEMRLAFLKAKATHQPISPIPIEVLEIIAHKIQSNTPELEEALTRIVAFAVQNQAALSIEQASIVLNDMVQIAPRKTITPDHVIEQTAQFYNIDPAELRSHYRYEKILLPQQIAMFIIREHTESSLAKIGQKLGGCSSGAVTHAIKKIERELEINLAFRQQINIIVRLIYS